MVKKITFAILSTFLFFTFSLNFVHAESVWKAITEGDVTTFGIQVGNEILPIVVMSKNHAVDNNSVVVALSAVWPPEPENVDMEFVSFPREPGFPLGKIFFKNTGLENFPIFTSYICGLTYCAEIRMIADLPLTAVPLRGHPGVYVLPDNR